MEKHNVGSPVPKVLLRGKVLLGKSWRMYKERFGQIVLTMLPIFLVSAVYKLLTLPPATSYILTLTAKASGAVIILALIVYLLLGIAMVVLSTVSINAFILLFKESGTLSVKAAFRAAWPLTLPTIWIGLLAAFVICGGFVLLIIPGILVGVWVMFALPVFVLEGRRGMQSLLASKHYAQGHFWKIVWRLIVMAIFLILVTIVIGLVMTIVAVPLLYVNATLSLVITTLISVFFSAFLLQPIMMIYQILLYYNLKAVKGEGVAPKGKKLFTGLAILGLLFALMMAASFTSLFLKAQSAGVPMSSYGAFKNQGIGLPADFNLDNLNLPQ